jgi:sulfate transport system permease protein
MTPSFGRPLPPATARSSFRQPSILPGFGLTLGFTTFFLSALVLIPLAALVMKAATIGWQDFLHVLFDPRVLASFRLSFGASLLAATINCIFGFIIAWTLVRYEFPGRKLIDALIDMPFALPTAVSGIALTAVFADNGWIGQHLAPFGIKVAYTWIGVVVALTLIGLPFVVRSVQPALAEVQRDLEDAAETLGAGRVTIFRRIVLPTVTPALLTGFTMAFARAVGEYGSVIFISGNLPMKTEITPLLIVIKLEQFDYKGAAAIGFIMLVISFVMLLSINLLQTWGRRRHVAAGR